jgi:hypothetical protein
MSSKSRSRRSGSPGGNSAAARWSNPQAAAWSPRASAAGGDEPRGRPPAEAVQPRIGAVELGAVAVGALEVVADDLVLFDERCVSVEPVGERFVELGASLLGQRVIGGVADEEVAEAECFLVRVRRMVRPNHLFAHEREEVRCHVFPFRGWREILHGAPMEDLTFDGAAADHVALARTEPVKPGLEERLDRGWYDDVGATIFAHRRKHLLDEERIPVRGLKDPRARVVCELGPAGEP